MTDTAASDDPVLVIHLNKLKGYVAAGVTGAIRVAGGVLIAHGFGNTAMLNDYVGPASQEITGWLFVIAGQAWAWFREHHKNDRIIKAAEGAVLVKDGPIQ